MIASMFFAVSKVFWFFANPGNLFLLTLISGVLLRLFPNPKLKKTGAILVLVAAAFSLIIAVVPWGNVIGLPLEDRFPIVEKLPIHVDGIVVAGGVVMPTLSAARGQIQVGGGVERVLALGVLAKRYPDAKIVYSAGSGDLFRQQLKEADYIEPVLTDLGVRSGRLLIENQSRNTHENAVFSRKLVSPAKDETWVLITSAFHMPRTVGTFRKAGWSNIVPYPVDYHLSQDETGLRFAFSSNLSTLNTYLREWIGLLAYRIMGKTDSLFPAPSHGGLP